MATITVDATHVHINLSRFERFFGLLTSLSIPLAHIQSAVHDDQVLSTLGIRAPGLAWPRRALIGTFRKWKFKDFVVWRNQPHLVVIQLEGENWNRIVIGVTEPDTIVWAINSATAR